MLARPRGQVRQQSEIQAGHLKVLHFCFWLWLRAECGESEPRGGGSGCQRPNEGKNALSTVSGHLGTQRVAPGAYSFWNACWLG